MTALASPDMTAPVNAVSLRREFHQGYMRLGDNPQLRVVCDLCRRSIGHGAFIFAYPVGPFEAESYCSACFQAAYFGES